MKARQRGRPVGFADLGRIEQALDSLKVARSLLRKSDAHNAANYVQRAVKSAQGALNNAWAHYREERKDEAQSAH
jgi:hypothetical protein